MLNDKRRLLHYGALPLAFGLAYTALYFSGVGPLQSIASPRHNREFGLLENTQNLLLIMALVTCWRSARAETCTAWRRLWRVGVVACFVLVMEEIDWGDHYWSALTGSVRPKGEYFNLHNQGNTTDTLKKAVDLGFTLFFALLPLLLRFVPARLRGLVPSPYSVLTLLAGVLVSTLAHELEDRGLPNNGSLKGNISEFRELFTYTVGALYLLEISSRRRCEPGGQDALKSPRADHDR